MRDHFFPDVPIERAANEMSQIAYADTAPGASAEEILVHFRQLDRQ